jgi:hypothetical protein
MTETTTAVTITRHLPKKLDAYRKNTLADEMAMQRMEELRISDHLKHVTESLKVMIKEAQKKQNIAAGAICQGYEMVEIACEQRIDLDRNKMVTVRLDTMADIDERALTAEEMAHYRHKKTVVLKP